jgi:hypothetical protein
MEALNLCCGKHSLGSSLSKVSNYFFFDLA